jgi:hypothetical protein
LYAALLVFVLACFSTDIAICSFNIQFLGHFKDRDNVALASVLENYDIVVIQELGIPGTGNPGDAYNDSSSSSLK